MTEIQTNFSIGQRLPKECSLKCCYFTQRQGKQGFTANMTEI